MEGHRRYADEPEPSWYSGQYDPPPPKPHDSGAFRLPEQRGTDYLTSTGSHARPVTESAPESLRMPVRGPEYPAVRPHQPTSLADAPSSSTFSGPASPVSTPPVSAAPGTAMSAYNEPTGVMPPLGRTNNKPTDGVYRRRHPLPSVITAVVTVLALVPAVLLLVRATFVNDPVAREIVPALLLVLGLPLTGIGLFALAGGGPVGREAWLRPPLAYLPVGLVLLLGAGLAVA